MLQVYLLFFFLTISLLSVFTSSLFFQAYFTFDSSLFTTKFMFQVYVIFVYASCLFFSKFIF